MCESVFRRLRRSRSGFRAALGAGVFLVLGATLVWAPSAQAQGTQCSALISMAPDIGQTPPGDVLTPGPPNNVVHITVSLLQTCTTANLPVTANVTGTTRVDVACASANNLTDPSGTGCAVATEQLNTLHVTGCVGVGGSTCSAVNDGNGNPTIAAITYTNACPNPPGGSTCLELPFGTLVQVATITATTQPGEQVISPATGEFAVTSSTGGSNVFTAAAQASAQGSAPEFYPAPPPSISLTKACAATFNAATQQVNVSFTSTLTNTGSFEDIINTSCADVPPTSLNGVPASLAPGVSATITGTYTQSSLTANDTLTCTGTGASTSTTVNQSANASCTAVTTPSLTVNKGCSAILNQGGNALDVTFTATVSNNGNEDLTSFTCSDSTGAALSGVPGSLAHGASAVVTGTYSINASQASDTLTCTGTGVVSSTVVQASGQATCSVNCSPSISVVKQCTNAASALNPVINFSGTITNTGNVELTGVTCTDQTSGGTAPVTPSSSTLPTPNGTATYSGNYNGVQGTNVDTVTCTGTVPAVCGGGTVNAQASATCTVPFEANLTTRQDPTQGALGDFLNDSAQLSGGSQPYGGTMTFSLFDPDQSGCVGDPRYQVTVAVNPDGSASTPPPGFQADKVGTWQWVVHFSGDANNPPADSGCGSEPVVIPPGEQVPTLSGWGMLLFVILLVGVGSLMLSRRRNLAG